uniref:dihydroxy-acid dehydratase domain-containing protein n=1 Tax=Ruegeria lacuscaerulensis TaxID=55218 RepID=UPI00147EA6F9
WFLRFLNHNGGPLQRGRITELLEAGLLPHPDTKGANGKSMAQNYTGQTATNRDVIRPVVDPLLSNAGFLNLKGNLFDSALMKTSVIDAEFRQRYLSDPANPDAFEGPAIVFDGPEDFHAKIDDPALNIDANCILVMRGAGPKGYPGGAEVVNMRPPSYLIKQGIRALPCIGDGRQSGTSGSASILNASPEAADGGGLAFLRTGDRIRVDLRERTVNALLTAQEFAQRREQLDADGGYPVPESQSPWQDIFRNTVSQFSEGMVMKGAPEYQDIARRYSLRNNH